MQDLTIRDIARIAGVSTTAVSFVLNDRPGVSDATRERVREVIARTGFTPNVHTRRLILHRSFTFHVVLYWHSHDLFNQFALEILHGIFEACKNIGYGVLFTFVDKSMDTEMLMKSIHSKDCDGVILSQISDASLLACLKREKIPFVCVDSNVTKDGSLPLVDVDYYRAAYDSVRYLVSHGHRDIGFIGLSTPLEFHASTFSGYTDALRDCGLMCRPSWIGNIAFAAGTAGDYFDSVLAGGQLPSAFLCTGDVLAIDLISRAKTHGISIPRDLSVISMDDLILSRYLDPALTTVTFDKTAMGKAAVEMLYKIIEGKEITPVTLMPVQLVERDTVASI